MSRHIYNIQIAGKVSSVKLCEYKKFLKRIEFSLLVEVSITNNNEELSAYVLEQRCIAEHSLFNTIEYYEKVNSKVVIKGTYIKAYSVFFKLMGFNPYIMVTSLEVCK